MELRRTETGFALYKEKEAIGHCSQNLGISDDEVNIAHINALIWSEGLDA